MPDLPGRRLLLVHAHPDDESSTTGATIARYVAEGAQVTLVTCTLGELGEVVDDTLGHLEAGDSLARHRLDELSQAAAALGLRDTVRLGGDGRYHDSGMVSHDDLGTARPPDQVAETAFWRADLLETALALVPVLRDRRPQVLVTYDPFGTYGHPDHIQAHRVAMYAAQLAGSPYRLDLGQPWTVARVLWITFGADDLRTLLDRAAAAGLELDFQLDPEALPAMVSPQDRLAARIPVAPWVEAKRQALASHRSQVDLSDPFWTLMTLGDDSQAECYLLGAGVPLPGPGPADDLFAGLPVQG
ncbi:MAG: N-acetyl-1-D-myo-inositol-2-amino-2-deoxy-alpha-D-glucopyranoside deacetylase [Actinomycetia bacterium]|nr:N-acetyl-1-D-myo-inositol-2-amino-2-deoxy-alpha-D-glucopyranoside deacetylase [Actinomycetes bacterium]